MKRMLCAAAVLVFLLLPGAALLAGQGAFGVSVNVVLRHQPQLAQALPLPDPGHLMVENASGRHYYFDGTLAVARAYYFEQMRQRGYTLVDERTDDTNGCAMRWRNGEDLVDVELRGAIGLSATRISLRAMKDARPHANG